MHRDAEDDARIYKAVVNHEEQYSVWRIDKPNPPGWRDVGKTGTKSEVLEYIDDMWSDMRPLSVRRHMERLKDEG